MSHQAQDQELIAGLEQTAGLAPGLLALLLALEGDFPDLSARGERKQLYRALEEIVDAAADETKKS